jgi:hypothetical protein
MPAWKVLFIMVFACACLGLALATLVVPMTLTVGGDRWLWLAGLLAATVCMSTLLILFLRRSSGFMR